MLSDLRIGLAYIMQQLSKSYRLKVIDHRSFGCDFPTAAKKATVLRVVDPDPLNVIFANIAAMHSNVRIL